MHLMHLMAADLVVELFLLTSAVYSSKIRFPDVTTGISLIYRMLSQIQAGKSLSLNRQGPSALYFWHEYWWHNMCWNTTRDL